MTCKCNCGGERPKPEERVCLPVSEVLELRRKVAEFESWKEGKLGVEEFYAEKWAKEQALQQLASAQEKIKTLERALNQVLS